MTFPAKKHFPVNKSELTFSGAEKSKGRCVRWSVKLILQEFQGTSNKQFGKMIFQIVTDQHD